MLAHVCPDVGRLHIPDEEFAKSQSMGFWLPPKDLSAWRAECYANEPDPSMPEGRFLGDRHVQDSSGTDLSDLRHRDRGHSGRAMSAWGF